MHAYLFVNPPYYTAYVYNSHNCPLAAILNVLTKALHAMLQEGMDVLYKTKSSLKHVYLARLRYQGLGVIATEG